ncbi:unnamed protein product [Arabidopsis thaliana]|uniref:Uncharacterized protein n=4 Tax=Arabidopsis TaxID=3701 RepID=A0A654F799_ARATH|nr:uncharacterized protein AT3G09863 [Arabidopsis thaliana]AEE74823.1 hypothetical protein AT3G09863 [Arabidopsis thaliana]KAG7624641.1 hypothetical protein ISN45_At03g009450 [Arabidopsis thaliana x Arabidopsis arenosa]KAG7630650.1 hypothetical protein ISN44_As03g009560 [Arabidopsis suecica]VYS56835.1 unnamed protein product [Arabidopsis thaliana]|eukprot:NP_001118605.1 hypothetical protein AT3G09863 [Arabidopsis thaliana]
MDKTVLISTGSVLYPNVACDRIERPKASDEAAQIVWYQAPSTK